MMPWKIDVTPRSRPDGSTCWMTVICEECGASGDAPPRVDEEPAVDHAFTCPRRQLLALANLVLPDTDLTNH
jgi:hypothetical protein